MIHVRMICCNARLIYPTIDKRRTNQLLKLDRTVILITVAILTDHGEMRTDYSTHQITFPLVEEEETVIQFVKDLLQGADLGYLDLHSLST